MKLYSPRRLYQVTLMSTAKFWPLDFDSDGEIYENVAWDLPGFRPCRPKAKPAKSTLQKRRKR
jgi:hypothetical protein